MRNSLALCHDMKAFLFEARPDLMPYGFLSDLELELWGRYYDEMNSRIMSHG